MWFIDLSEFKSWLCCIALSCDAAAPLTPSNLHKTQEGSLASTNVSALTCASAMAGPQLVSVTYLQQETSITFQNWTISWCAIYLNWSKTFKNKNTRLIILSFRNHKWTYVHWLQLSHDIITWHFNQLLTPNHSVPITTCAMEEKLAPTHKSDTLPSLRILDLQCYDSWVQIPNKTMNIWPCKHILKWGMRKGYQTA